jgi:hypothetical protein
MSLKYIYSIYIPCLCGTCFGRTGPSSENTYLRNPLHCAHCQLYSYSMSLLLLILMLYDFCSSYLMYCGHSLGCILCTVSCVLYSLCCSAVLYKYLVLLSILCTVEKNADGPVLPKHVAHKHRMYVCFSNI